MKALLVLSIIGHMASKPLDPERPIVASVIFEGDGCHIDSNTSFANAQDSTKKYCVMIVDLDLSQRCYQNAKVSTLLGSYLPKNSTASLLISSSVGDIEFGSPIDISFSGINTTEKEVAAKLLPQGPRICNCNATLMLNSTLDAQAFILNQSIDVQAFEVGENFANGPIVFPVTFSGTGCPRSSAIMRASNWEVAIDYSDFNVVSGEMKNCQVLIPVDLHGYCLTSVSRTIDVYNPADLFWSNQLLLNDEPLGWESESLSTLVNGENHLLFGNSTSKVCGQQMTMIIDTKITGLTGVNKKGGSLKRQVFRIESLELPKMNSGTGKTGPVAWIMIPAILLMK